MDFKKVLDEWKNYQENKLVMANTFRCIATFATCTIDGVLAFRGAGAQKVLHFETIEHLHIDVLMSDILGTAPQGSQIRFSLTNERILVVRFPSQDIRRAAHQAFRQFEREEFGPTPPTSGESGSDN